MSGPEIHNQTSQPVHGIVVQAGTVLGGVHAHPAPAAVVPRQLPAGIPKFVGRARELHILNKQLTKAWVLVISGMPGIGKTSLAVYWARRRMDRFPDGQLYANLGGFDRAEVPTGPAVVIHSFLDALHVPAAGIPADPGAAAALYRSLVADKRMLIVLDNARDADQVRPLLPGSRTCRVLVTSRQQLPSLVASAQATQVSLELFSTDEAEELLARFLGAARVRAENAAVHDLIERCARLPIALAIVGARAVTNPHTRLDDLATELGELSTGDSQSTDIRAVFSWSYRALSQAAARLFRWVGLHPGPDIDLQAAASLAGASPAHTRPLLAELTTAHLLQEHTGGRYRLHDLLRAYAAERATDDDAEHRHAALHRTLDHYVHTGFAADQRINPDRQPITLDAPQPGAVVTDFADDAHAWEWFVGERLTLLAAVNHASRNEFDRHAWQLPWVLATFLDRHGHWPESAAAHEIALAAVIRLGDRPAQARMHRFLGWAHTRLGNDSEALTHLRNSLTLWKELGDVGGQATAYHGLSLLNQWHEQYPQALDQARHAMELYRICHDLTGEATALNTLGWNHARLGDYDQAMAETRQSLSLFRQLDDHFGQAEALDTIGYLHHHLGQHDHARLTYQKCLVLRRELGDHYLTATALLDLGETYHAIQEFGPARDAWLQALTILEQLHHPDAEHVRTKLR
jgi:tetratricopeptide (TPR) repeat protein